MNVPLPVSDWLTEKCGRDHWSTVLEARSVTREWVRHTGGRIMRAGLSGEILPSKEFELSVQAESAEPEYIAAAKNAVVTVLMSQGWAPVLRVKVTLTEFKVHPGESSYAAFYAAAHEVMSHLLGVAPDTQHNIDW